MPWIGAAYLLLRFGAGLGGLFLPGAVVLAAALLLGAPATVLLFVIATAWARGEEMGLRESLHIARTLIWRAAAIGAMLIVATALIMVNIVFYQQLGGWLGALLSGLMIWLLLLLGIVAVYVFPVLVTQEEAVWETLRQAFLLAVDNIKLLKEIKSTLINGSTFIDGGANIGFFSLIDICIIPFVIALEIKSKFDV